MTTPARVAAAAVIGVLALGGALYALGTRWLRVRRAPPDGLSDAQPDTARPGRWPACGGTVCHQAVRPDVALDPLSGRTRQLSDGCLHGQPARVHREPGGRRDPLSRSRLPEGWEGAPRNSVAGPQQGEPDGAVAGLRPRRIALLGPRVELPPTPDIPVGPTVDDFANGSRGPSDARRHRAGRCHPCRVSREVHGPSRCLIPCAPTTRPLPWRTRSTGRGNPGSDNGPGSRWHLWILDVNGIRVVIQAMDFAATPRPAPGRASSDRGLDPDRTLSCSSR